VGEGPASCGPPCAAGKPAKRGCCPRPTGDSNRFPPVFTGLSSSPDKSLISRRSVVRTLGASPNRPDGGSS
jgi:hypothetical protein